MIDLPEELAAQARILFSNMPANEVTDDEPIAFKTDEEGRLQMRRGFDFYTLRDGATWRVRKTPTGERITIWKNRRVIGQTVVPVSAAVN